MLRSFKPNLADVSLDGLEGWLPDPLFWLSIGGPAIILAIAALYFYSKARRLTKGETRRKSFDRTGFGKRKL